MALTARRQRYARGSMGNTKRQELALRAIVVSGRAALGRAQPHDVELIMRRVDELLAELEEIVIRDGGDQRILAAIEAERRRLHE